MKKYKLISIIAIMLFTGCSLNAPQEENKSTELVQDTNVVANNQETSGESLDIEDAQDKKASVLENVIESQQVVKNDQGVIELKFKNTFSNDYLKSISGQKVTMTGYISTLSPINGEFAYLMNLPYQSCPYCIPGTSEIYNTIAIYAKNNSKIEFTDSPVTVTGILETGDFTDAFGYEYNVRIKDVNVKKADVSKLSQNILMYSAISQEGIVDDINNVFMSLDQIIFYDYYQEYYGMPLESIETFDTDIINTIISKIKAISTTNYNDIIQTLEKSIGLAKQANENVKNKNYEENKNLQEGLNQVFSEFGMWMAKYEM